MPINIKFLLIYFWLILLSGCATLQHGKIPFQELNSSRDKCSPVELKGYSYNECIRKNFWGYNSRYVPRFREQVFIAGFKFQDLTISGSDATVLGNHALIYGIAKETLKFGVTHFKILPTEKYADMRWNPAQAPSIEIRGRIYGYSFTGTGSLVGGGRTSFNHDAKGIYSEIQVLAYFTVANNPQCEPAQGDNRFESIRKKVQIQNVHELPHVSGIVDYWANAKGVIEVFEGFMHVR